MVGSPVRLQDEPKDAEVLNYGYWRAVDGDGYGGCRGMCKTCSVEGEQGRFGGGAMKAARGDVFGNYVRRRL